MWGARKNPGKCGNSPAKFVPRHFFNGPRATSNLFSQKNWGRKTSQWRERLQKREGISPSWWNFSTQNGVPTPVFLPPKFKFSRGPPQIATLGPKQSLSGISNTKSLLSTSGQKISGPKSVPVRKIWGDWKKNLNKLGCGNLNPPGPSLFWFLKERGNKPNPFILRGIPKGVQTQPFNPHSRGGSPKIADPPREIKPFLAPPFYGFHTKKGVKFPEFKSVKNGFVWNKFRAKIATLSLPPHIGVFKNWAQKLVDPN